MKSVKLVKSSAAMKFSGGKSGTMSQSLNGDSSSCNIKVYASPDGPLYEVSCLVSEGGSETLYMGLSTNPLTAMIQGSGGK